MAAAENKGKRLSKYVDYYVVYDLETTGISSVKDDIIEISAALFGNRKIYSGSITLRNNGF